MGEVFAGRYELIDPIGRGGVGAVWRAWDHRRRRCVAAKVLQQSDAHTLLRFVREQALRIDHPHVLAPASWAADDDKVLFTMDLVTGGSLAHLIGDYGPLPPRFVCVLLDQLLSGLAAVHAEGVVHRDIKPANILLEATGTGRPHLRVSDFGIAMRKGEPRLTETNYVMGTPGYFAPEQIMGADPDFPSDLFAVGLVALYLLEGQKPDARALVEYFAAHGTPGAPQGVPEPLWQVLAGLLQPDPQLRFRTATGARKALASAVELLPDAAPDEEPVEVFDQVGPLPEGFVPRELPPVLRHPRTSGTPRHPSGTPGSPQGQAHDQEWPHQGQEWPHQGQEWPHHGQEWPQDRERPHSRPSGPLPTPTPSTAAGFPPVPPPYPPSYTPTPTPVTKRYTGQSPQAHAPAPPMSGPPGTTGTAGTPTPTPSGPVSPPTPPAARHKRSGPPPKATGPKATDLQTTGPRATTPKGPAPKGTVPKGTFPVLLLALLCFAVGFWALSQL